MWWKFTVFAEKIFACFFVFFSKTGWSMLSWIPALERDFVVKCPLLRSVITSDQFRLILLYLQRNLRMQQPIAMSSQHRLLVFNTFFLILSLVLCFCNFMEKNIQQHTNIIHYHCWTSQTWTSQTCTPFGLGANGQKYKT